MTELALKLPNGFMFTIQEHEEGYEYTFYNLNYEGMDGGIYETNTKTILNVARQLPHAL